MGYGIILVAALASLGVVPKKLQLRAHASSVPPAWKELRDPPRAATPHEVRLGEIASSIARRPVGVRCDDLSDVRLTREPGGVVQFFGDVPANYTRIRSDVCTQLRFLRRDRGSGGAKQAGAALVLAHESFHLMGITTEAVAECYAVQFVPRVARALGATDANASALHGYAVDLYRRQKPPYTSPDCRPGGALDLGGGRPNPSNEG